MDKHELRRLALKALIDTKGHGAITAVSQATGIDASYVSRMLYEPGKKGRKGIGEDLWEKLVSAFPELDGGDPASSFSSISATETAGDYVRVDQIDAEAQMGAMGRANDDYPEVIKAMDFAPAYIRSVVGFVPPAGRLKLVTGVGDSMAPKIRPGEAVLVDTGCNEFVGDGLYLINTGYGQQIKALQAAPDGIWARSSDQVLYPPFKLTEDSIIGGRVYLIHHLERVA